MIINSEMLIDIVKNLEEISKKNLKDLKDIISESKICYETSFDGKIVLDGFLEKSDIL